VTRAAPPVKPSMRAVIGVGVPTMPTRLLVMQAVQQLSMRSNTESELKAAKRREGAGVKAVERPAEKVKT
jgi:hypothetical protein